MKHNERLQALYRHESKEIRFLTNVYQDSNLIVRGIYALTFQYGLNPQVSQFDISFITMDDGIRYSVQSLKEWDNLAEAVYNNLREDAERESISEDIR